MSTTEEQQGDPISNKVEDKIVLWYLHGHPGMYTLTFALKSLYVHRLTADTMHVSVNVPTHVHYHISTQWKMKHCIHSSCISATASLKNIFKSVIQLTPHVAVPRAGIPITEQSPSLAAFTVYQHCSMWSMTCKIQCPFSETSIELQERCTWLANHETSTILEPHTKNYDNIPFPVVDCSSA